MPPTPTENKGDKSPQKGGGVDPRLLALIAIVFVVGLAVFLAHVMASLGQADNCLASGGRQC